ncbi:OppA family ABC transporter substrate-binding lipoprotein [Mycoplasma sp. 1654_15]|uniref:OppA family ABC transporter substrate-binding lipoprotein n=1 Tax=Mycoplasma sp. 1654_15 TaxID=2725994 RepID=UPI00144A080E|nr:peptide ABC transporter substrate-binding protein [Mycoplasma sp. 1654_15]QJB70961.1 peptide ABC transporter substrate-binding protein [Mycoplasma sp. 1654_15]
MLKKKKLLLGSLVSTIPISVLVSCGVTPLWQKQELVRNVNSADSSFYAFYGFTNFAGSPSREDDYLRSGSYLVQTMYEGETILSKEAQPDRVEQGTTIKSYQYKYTSPSYKYLVLALAKRFIVTAEDENHEEQVYIFDNDKHEIGHLASNEKQTQSIYTLSSNDPKSINSQFFRDTLAKAKKLQIEVKKDVPWVDYQANKTEYTVKPEDFFYSWKLKNLYDQHYRQSHGGSKEIDDKVKASIKNLNPQSEKFTSDLSNDYLFKVFGIDKNKLLDEKTFLTDFQGEKVLTFLPLETKGLQVNYYQMLQKIVFDSNYFSPVPSEYIAKRVAEQTKEVEVEKEVKDKDGKPQKDKDGKEIKVKVKEKQGLFGETGEALKYGIYWYGKDYDKDLLYASPWIINYGDKNKIVYIRNPYYPRTGWKEAEPSSFKKITYKYSAYPNASAFESAQFNNFKEQTKASSGFEGLSDNDKKYALAHFEELGGRYVLGKALDHIPWLTYSSLMPGSMNQVITSSNNQDVRYDDPTKLYKFNDAFSKLYFGHSLEEIAKGGAKVVPYVFGGRGLEFRSIIYAAWNVYTISRGLSNTALPWYSFVSPDNVLAKDKTARQLYEKVSTIFAVDQNGNKFYTKTPEQEKQQNFNNPSSNALQIQAPNFDILKNKMKELLDDFYAKENLKPEDKVQWTLATRYTNATNKEISAYQQAAKAIEALDPRLSVDVQSEVPVTKDNYLNFLIRGIGPYHYVGWSYDYNGAGTAIDGLTQSAGFGLAAASYFASLDANSNLAKSFPMFYKYSKDLETFFSKEEYKGKMRPFSEWKDSPNAPNFGQRNLNDPNDKNRDQRPDVTKWITFRVVEKQDPQTKKMVKKFEQYDKNFSLGEETGLFNNQFQLNHSDEEIAQLLSEITSLYGFLPQTDGITTIGSTPTISFLNPNLQVPDTENSFAVPDQTVIKPFLKKQGEQ